jgi:N-ethylmaleimide reductase
LNRNLFQPALLGTLDLRNRIVMSPMTRNRSIGNIPPAFAAAYYGQRASAGLIITEGTSPSPDGLGYARIPGLFSPAQVKAWQDVTQAVHRRNGHIFAQLMHTGRIGHPANLPKGATLLGPMAEAAKGEMFTDASGMQPFPVPRAMTEADLAKVIAEYVKASTNALDAGFDGVELHAANGYLLEQFLNPLVNRRKDGWGGTLEGRARLLLDTVRAVTKAIGTERVGVRLSPHGVFNDMPPFPDVQKEYGWFAEQLNGLGIAYLHLVDHSSMGAPAVPEATRGAIRSAFRGTLILSGGYTRLRAEEDIASGQADLVAFGRPFIANPDLPERLFTGAPLAVPDPSTFYTPGEAGYDDYPALDLAKDLA